MRNFIGKTILIISALTPYALFASTLGFLIYFATHFELFENIKQILGTLFETSLGCIVLFHIKNKIKSGLSRYGSLSKAIIYFFQGEPVILGCAWLLIIAQIIVFSYLLPIHFVVVTIKSYPILKDNSQIIEAQIVKGASIYDLPADETSSTRFASSRFLVWGDTLSKVRVNINGDEYIRSIPWEGMAFLNLLQGNEVQVIENKVRIDIVALPQNAIIQLSSPFDSVFVGHASLIVPKNKFISLKVSADIYKPDSLHFQAISNKSIKIKLAPMDGTVIFQTYFQDQKTRIPGMKILLNGKLIKHNSWQTITLSPGEYRVYMSKFLDIEQKEKASIDTFDVTIKPGEKHFISKYAQIISN